VGQKIVKTNYDYFRTTYIQKDVSYELNDYSFTMTSVQGYNNLFFVLHNKMNYIESQLLLPFEILYHSGFLYLLQCILKKLW
jgi:hypothetical protein